jgi:flagellar biogenesis protein FliO
MDFLTDIFGESGALAIKFLLALIVVLGLIALVAIIIRRISDTGFGITPKSRQPRLQVMEAIAIDTKRRLVLVRRDDIEHLLLIGNNDIVVEQTIIKGIPAALRRQGAQAKRAAQSNNTVTQLPESSASKSSVLSSGQISRKLSENGFARQDTVSSLQPDNETSHTLKPKLSEASFINKPKETSTKSSEKSTKTSSQDDASVKPDLPWMDKNKYQEDIQPGKQPEAKGSNDTKPVETSTKSSSGTLSKMTALLQTNRKEKENTPALDTPKQGKNDTSENDDNDDALDNQLAVSLAEALNNKEENETLSKPDTTAMSPSWISKSQPFETTTTKPETDKKSIIADKAEPKKPLSEDTNLFETKPRPLFESRLPRNEPVSLRQPSRGPASQVKTAAIMPKETKLPDTEAANHKEQISDVDDVETVAALSDKNTENDNISPLNIPETVQENETEKTDTQNDETEPNLAARVSVPHETETPTEKKPDTSQNSLDQPAIEAKDTTDTNAASTEDTKPATSKSDALEDEMEKLLGEIAGSSKKG